MIKNYYVVKAKNDIIRPQRIRFKAAEDQTDFNLFSDEKVVLPDSQYFDVYINDEKTNQEYTSISFNTDDIVTIQLNDDSQYYPYFKCGTVTPNSSNVIKEVLEPLPLLKLDESTDVTDFGNYFSFCTNLTSIPENLFINNINSTTFYSCFYGCLVLTEIPENLFADNTNATSFASCFQYCSNLTEIPENLFANNTNATSFASCFYGCTGLTTVSENLFFNNVNTTSFYGCFWDCSNLTMVSENLFANNTEVTDFSSCFTGCTNLKNFRLKIGSSNVTNVSGFIPADSNGTVIVPAGSTTYDTFVKANISGLTIETF